MEPILQKKKGFSAQPTLGRRQATAHEALRASRARLEFFGPRFAKRMAAVCVSASVGRKISLTGMAYAR
jgi:hypothetical protein